MITMQPQLQPNDSFAVRRKLFKHIWDTAMRIDETDISGKQKVIKTQRVEEMEKNAGGRKKKQRIKNLRNVCRKILDFCDRQDAEDTYYSQALTAGAVYDNPYKIKLLERAIVHKPRNEMQKMEGKTVSRNTSPIKFATNKKLKKKKIIKCAAERDYIVAARAHLESTALNSTEVKVTRKKTKLKRKKRYVHRKK